VTSGGGIAAWLPHGEALRDYLAGETGAAVTVHGEAGDADVIPAALFFRGPEEFSALDAAALELCHGRVLDVGAGAGCHALALQAQGLAVSAIDLVPDAVEVMRRRGVADPRCVDLDGLEAPPFDTILLMMNGIGMAERVAGIPRFLEAIRRRTRPDGQLVLDSFDPRTEAEAAVETDGLEGYPGELRFQLEYRGRRGPWYSWLFVDFDTLARQAARAGWEGETVWREEDGHYLARFWPHV
jgi:SAM-dependent methyltransferase